MDSHKKLADILENLKSAFTPHASAPQTLPDVGTEGSTQTNTNEADATPQRKRDRSRWKPTGVIANSPASSVAGTNSDADTPDPLTAETSPPPASPPIPATGSTLSEVTTEQNSLVAPSSIVTTKSTTPNTATPAPKLKTFLANMVNAILHPFAGNTPAAPAGTPAAWTLFAAARRETFGATAANVVVPIPPGGTTFVVKGDGGVSKTYTITPVGPETMTGIYNMSTAGPVVNESIQGYQKFNVEIDGVQQDPIYAYVSTSPYRSIYLADQKVARSQVLYVDSGIASLLGESPSTATLPDGTVISTYFNGVNRNVYVAIPGDDPLSGDDDTVVDYSTNTRTGATSDLSSLINALGFNAAHVPPILPYYLKGVGTPTFTSVSALPPITIAPQGYQIFEYYDPAAGKPTDSSTPIGTFYGVTTVTKDLIGFATQAILITGYPPGEDGAGLPPVGTVWNTINYGTATVVYSSTPQPNGPAKVTVTLADQSTPDRPIDLSWLYPGFDASKGVTDGTNVGSFKFGNDGLKVEPVGAAVQKELLTGVNGLPPVSATVSAIQQYNLVNSDGDVVGTFTATVTTIPKMLLTSPSQALLVTDSSVPNLVPVGTVFDVTTQGFDIQSVYADRPGVGEDGKNLITLTFTNRKGQTSDHSWRVQNKDVSTGLTGDGVSYAIDPWVDLFRGLV
ncbi:MAG TPA: hypothetical protein VH496_11750 [Mycobacterium sp.]